MTRHTQIHETTRYEVIVRGVQSRAEAEAIVKAVEALPVASAWIPARTFDSVEDAVAAAATTVAAPTTLDPATVALMEAVNRPEPEEVLNFDKGPQP